MSISNKINSIRTHLEDDYTALEQLGVSVEDRNIENIKDMAHQIYAKFPKTDYEEGSNITLSNTLKGKLDFEDDIVGYGDTSQKSYQGYNELNLQDYTETINGVTITIKNGVIMLNGNSTNYTTKVIPQATSSQFNGEYNLNYEYVSGTTNNPANLNLYNGSQEIATLYFGNLSRNQSVTFNEDTISTRIYFHNNAEFNNYIIKPMLYKGAYDSSKTFEPYVGGTASPNPSYPQDIEVVRGTQTVYIKDENNNIIDTKTINLGEYEFAKIGNYVDTIEYDVENDKVYKNENVNEHIFTENENISLQSINSYGIANFFISHSLGSVSNFALCNYFTLQTSGISVTQEEGFLWQHNGVYFRIKSSTASDVSSFKTWLGSHNTKVKYALAEAVKKPITGTLKDQIKALYYSHSFTGTTIIEIDGQLPLIIKVRALKGE